MTTWRTHRPQPIIPPQLEEQPIIQQDPAPPVIHEQEATDQVVQEERWDAQLRRWEDQQREVARQERGILEAGSPPNEPREHRYPGRKRNPPERLGYPEPDNLRQHQPQSSSRPVSSLSVNTRSEPNSQCTSPETSPTKPVTIKTGSLAQYKPVVWKDVPPGSVDIGPLPISRFKANLLNLKYGWGKYRKPRPKRTLSFSGLKLRKVIVRRLSFQGLKPTKEKLVNSFII